MVKYYVVRDETGEWMLGPHKGTTPNRRKAYPYRDGDRHLKGMVSFALDLGYKLRLRMVEDGAPAKFLSDRQWVHCPACDGTGIEWKRPFYECPDCGGTGTTEKPYA